MANIVKFEYNGAHSVSPTKNYANTVGPTTMRKIMMQPAIKMQSNRLKPVYNKSSQNNLETNSGSYRILRSNSENQSSSTKNSGCNVKSFNLMGIVN